MDGIEMSELNNILNITSKGSVFYFNGSYHCQIDSGHRLSPCPSTCKHVSVITKLIGSENALHHSFQFYVNIFMCILKKTLCILMSLTHETEENVIPFLEIRVYYLNGQFNTPSHKSTFSGVNVFKNA